MTTTYRLSAPSAEQLHDLPVHTELRLPSMPSSPIVKTRSEDGVPWLASVQVERRLGREVTASWYGSGDLAAAIGDGMVDVTEPEQTSEQDMADLIRLRADLEGDEGA